MEVPRLTQLDMYENANDGPNPASEEHPDYSYLFNEARQTKKAGRHAPILPVYGSDALVPATTATPSVPKKKFSLYVPEQQSTASLKRSMFACFGSQAVA
eukprot:TRINITY_DN3955_c0_g1_i1.p1 TRINITY_DN3955_c0_g1~~TRINITY_DN3955_c0_g1_i1.p1  ORF type:complete len:100 (+),score=12.77 TRINITY_DN3955_c0_g1_i1:346-645(+)